MSVARRAKERRRRFDTRRRLVAAFSAVLAAFVLALSFQFLALRRMEATFAVMKDHEAQMLLALQLEEAVRAQYGQEVDFVLGVRGGETARYESARARALALTRALDERVDGPESIAWMNQIREASAELDRMFREEAGANPPRDSAASLERGYSLVSLIEENVDSLFRLLQHATSTFREQLVGIERAARRWTAILLVATPVLVAVAVLYLSRSVARPLARLSEGAAAIAGGDLDTRIDIDTPDEFGALAAEFNAMTVALKQHQRRLVESEKLAGIGRLAAGVAHELNNPLQVTLGYLSLARDVADERLARQLAAAEEETLRCREIVDGLLELSRPRDAVAPAPVDLRSLCEDVSGAIRVSSQQRAARVTVDGAGVAFADRPKLRQVVFNLVRNAAEAAGPAGDVRVRIGAAGEMVEVAVADSGPGVAPEARARMFEPFFTTKANGTGLGLAVSRAIVRAHGGEIDVRNAASGGAVFTLRLPRARKGEA